MLDDEVWRLEKIRKNGPYHQALSNEGIDSVQKFLQAYMMDEQKLIKVKATRSFFSFCSNGYKFLLITIRS